MGKGQSPTPDELKFIYKLLSEGYLDADILARYDELECHGKLGSLPYRTDIRFIRQKRKEFEAAGSILETKIKQRVDPVITKSKGRTLGPDKKSNRGAYTIYTSSSSNHRTPLISD